MLDYRCKGEKETRSLWRYSDAVKEKYQELRDLKYKERKDGIAELLNEEFAGKIKCCNQLLFKYGVSVRNQAVWIQVKCMSCNKMNDFIIKLNKNEYKLINYDDSK